MTCAAIIGALMTKGGRPVELVDTNQAHVRALNAGEACTSGQLTLCQPACAILPGQMRGPYHLVFLLNMQTANPRVLSHLAPHLHDDSTVCTLQNGIPEPSVAAFLNARRVIGGTVCFGTAWLGPGHSSVTTAADLVRDHAFEIGALNGQSNQQLALVRDFLGCVWQTRGLDDLMGVRWSKLLMNATFSGMSAALGCEFGDVLDNRTAVWSVLHIAAEVVRAAQADGHRMAPMQDEHFGRFARPGDDAATFDMIHRIWDPHRTLRASMLQDLEKRTDTEINFINGLVCAVGRRHGFATPLNDLVTRLVRDAQSTRPVPDLGTVRLFADQLATTAAPQGHKDIPWHAQTPRSSSPAP